MRKTMLSALAVALLVGSAAQATAQEALKPMIVASFAGWQEMINDLDYVGEVSDNPDLGRGLEGLLTLITQGQGLDWLDKTKPWGLAVSTDGLQFQFFAFAPIKDLDAFLDIISGVAGDPKEEPGDVWKVDIQSMSLYLKQQGDWTFISLGSEFFLDLPEDPTSLLTGLVGKYDVGARIYMNNIPEIFRQLIIEQIRLGMEQGFEGQLSMLPGGIGDNLPDLSSLGGGGAMQEQMQALMAQMNFDAIAKALNDTDELTVGMSIDRTAKKVTGDFTMTAVDGSGTVTELAQLSSVKTRFGGFLVPDAALSANVAMPLSSGDIVQVRSSVESMRSDLVRRVDEAGGILGEDRIKDLLKTFIGDLFDVADRTIDAGMIDVGVAMLGEGPHTLALGGKVADGKRLQEVIDGMIDTIESEAGFYGFDRDYAEYKGVKFYKVDAPLPPDEIGDTLASLFGTLRVVMGFSENAAYLGMGEDPLEAIKKAMDDSEASADSNVPPLRATVKLGTLLKLMPAEGEQAASVKAAADALDGADDRIDITMSSIERGINIHFEGQEGLLKLFGVMLTSLGPGAGLPQF